MNEIDEVLFSHSPAVMVPRFGKLSTPEESGHRYLVASTGVFLHVYRPWLDLKTMIAPSSVRLPFGDVQQACTLPMGQVPTRLVRHFFERAFSSCPNEAVALVVWNEKTRVFRYIEPHVETVSRDHVTYQRPDLGDGEHLVLDMHSHGRAPAFFSATDDIDDASEVKFSLVFGSLDCPTPTVAMRLCAQGVFLNQPVTREALIWR